MMYINTASHILIKIERWVYRNGSTVKSSVSSSREPGLNYQYIYIYIYGGPSPVPGDLILCSVFSGHRIHMQNTLTLKIK